MHKFTNQLIHESSPYLLQHAHNPVNWFPWGEEALNKAKKENKPILVSIGYAACHWCHVMERESFEDETTAALMNEHFINIKIDREERPDLDHIYMDAVQAISGSGGWPLNVFLMPDGKPFYGGTYFPPQKAFNRPSWQDVLKLVSTAYKERQHELEAQAENLTAHLIQSNSFGTQKTGEGEILNEEKTAEIERQIMQSADKLWGGFGKAPKFPQTFSIQYLLRYARETGELRYADQAILSLDKMIDGGIYDQLGGGFARYSTDTEWLAPHFEKMLYDNALLISVLSEAFQLKGQKRYEEVIHETMDFLKREMLHEGKAFYAALDADSEGVEGKFYVWTREEVKDLLGKDAEIFCEFYDITEAGNWQDPHHEKKGPGINILRVKQRPEAFAERKGVAVDSIIKILETGKAKLLAQRNARIRPQLDDKVILGWNALMNIACSKAFAATGRSAYRELALANMDFLLANFSSQGGPELHHTWKNSEAKYPAFLDDYAFLVEAMMQLHEITGDRQWLTKAHALTEHVIAAFSEENGFFYYTRANQADIIVRKKEVYDGAVPSGNSVMAYNLYRLSILFDKKEWRERSLQMLGGLGKSIIQYPTSFGNWAALVLELSFGTNEIVLTGHDIHLMHEELLRQYIPHRVIITALKEEKTHPLLADKPVTEIPSIWLCKNYSCFPPLTAVRELISLINRRNTP